MAGPDMSWGQATGHVGGGGRKCADSPASTVGRRGLPYARGVPRPLRDDFPGAIWHLITRGVRKQPIFLDERDHEVFLALLEEVVEGFGWFCHAYCLMPNHYHLLVETPHANLSDGMERLNGRYAQYFNLRHDVEGHVFERRFRSILVKGDAH